MPKTLIIYETTHTENLSAMLVLADRHFNGITVFIPADYYEQALQILKGIHLENKISWVLQKNESHKGFIAAFFKAARQFTHLHINTLEHNVLFFTMHLLLLRKVEISMTVHSINDYKTFLCKGARDISESTAKFFLHRKVRQYRVLAPGMVATFQMKFPAAGVHFIPGNFYTPPIVDYKKHHDFFTIIIPGAVEEKRRNYELVLSFLQKYSQQLSAISPIQIILAGRADTTYAKKIIASLQQLEHDRFSLVYFQNGLPQASFNEIYATADITWCPINLHMKSIRGVDEINGVTHSPGIITDQICFGKPAIITRGLQFPSIMQDCNVEYDTEEELAEIFFHIISDPNKRDELLAKLKIACNYFRPANFESAFMTLMHLNDPKA